MSKRFIYLLILLTNLINAQIIDDFSDGDFINNPSWSGDINQFEVNSSEQLHLKSSGSDTSYLSTPFSNITNTEWRYWVKQSFNSSDNNYSRFYLASDSQDLEGPLKGYFVQMGSSDDNISLCKQNNNVIIELITCSSIFTGNTVNELHIKVLRDDLGNWDFYCDDSGGENFQSLGYAFDTTFTSVSYLGFFCKYTSSNATKFYYDNIYAGPVIIDTLPPEIIKLKVLNDKELMVILSESLTYSQAEDTSNYFVDNGIGFPKTATLNPSDLSSVNLVFTKSFCNGVVNNIQIVNIQDLSGNIIPETFLNFAYYQVKSHDIVINEIMADPDPPRDLPNAEYIELYNTNNLTIDLTNWTLEYGNSMKIFPDISIPAHGYLIICQEGSYNFISPVANLFTSASSLSNDGTCIILRNENRNVISTISYSNSWYDNSFKEDGGWSLEQIDPQNPCGGKFNWAASFDMEGGTPGRRNSVDGNNPDYDNPELLRVAVINENTICVYFTEPLDSVSLTGKSKYFIEPSLNIINEVMPVSPDFSSVVIEFSDSIRKGIIYSLSIQDTIIDCAGNVVPDYTSVGFAFPLMPEQSDIVINEILFNPKDYIVTGTDFVEIYNRSEKVLDLKNIIISSTDPLSLIRSSATVTGESYLMFPGDYLVLTKDPEIVITQYYTSNKHGFIRMSSFPSFNNDDGIVEISLTNGIILDSFEYNEDMHFDLMNTTDGISLERVSYNRPSDETTNWHSASEASGFATPAYENSMFNSFGGGIATVEISPKIFSPEDAYGNHLLNICYNIKEPGFLVNISIHNSDGRLIRKLKNSTLLGTKGCFSWDGLTDNGEKAAVGIYIILFETFNLKGKVERLKEICVVGSRF